MGVVERAIQIRQYIEQNAVNLPDDGAVLLPDVFPKWDAGTHYNVGERVRHGSILYRCLQEHDAQKTWTPTVTPSLWSQVLISDPDVIPEWIQPDSTNPYMSGDKVIHNGHIWESVVDNNVWEPSASLPTIWKVVE